MYKLSKYNLILEYSDNKYLWNTLSGALIELGKSGVDYIEHFQGKNDNTNEFSLLKNQGAIVNENLDETGLILSYEKEGLYSTKEETMYVVISLGLGCNYNCTYCFQNEHNHKKFMNKETAIDVAEYVCKQIESRSNLQKISLKWFGGEPLLYMKQMEIISNKIIECARKRNIEYIAGIITNGRYLTKNIAEKLKILKVIKAQITIDGLWGDYCSSKNATENDFLEVIDNLKVTSSILNITVRLNIKNNRAKEAIKVTDFLLKDCKLNGKIKIYFAFIKQFGISKEEGEKNYTSYVDNYIKWLKYTIFNYGYIIAKGTYPLKKLTSCGYIRSGSLCINYDGQLFKCESCFDRPDKVIGDVWNGRYYNMIERNYQTSVSERNRGKCLECSLLPVCMGGCVNDEINNDHEMECEAHKKMLFTLKLAEGGIRL